MASVITPESRLLMFRQAEVDQLFRVFLASARASARYRGGSYGGKLHLLRASGDVRATEVDPTFGWGRLVCGGIVRRLVPGTHMEILRSPYVGDLSATLMELLRQGPAPRVEARANT
jgi:thioesterase domain-containing protein